MFTKKFRRPLGISVGALIAVAGLVGCSNGAADSGVTEITYLTQSDPSSTEGAQRLLDAFNEANPDIHVTLVTQPAGTEGDNLMKTKLATGEMEDVFTYNTGSLFQALNPDQTLAELTDESWLSEVTDDFTKTVSTDKGVYGAPIGTSFAGGVLYNIPLYEKLGLSIPTTWDGFIANAEKVKQEAPDVAPVLQAYGETWTSQILVLADFANIDAQDPDWADDYTAGKAKYADQPAVAGFEHLQELFDRGLLNADFASQSNEGALQVLATGGAAHYPMLTNAVSAVEQNTPDHLDDVGFFALPAENAEDTSVTVWQPAGLFIPKTTEGDKLAAAKKLVEFIVSSDEACEISKQTGVPAGPYVTTACELDPDVPRMVQDIQPYFDEEATAPALEFLSPIKGPNLENIAIEVGSGIRSAQDGAALYDEDVKKQAQQLGLEGW